MENKKPNAKYLEGVDYVLLNGAKRKYFQMDDTLVQWNEGDIVRYW